MRPRDFVFIAALGICASVSASAQPGDQLLQYCRNPNPQIRLLACKLIIDSGNAPASALADAFASRGTAYSITGDLEHAIQDFDQAILLDSDRVLVFGYRGAAHLSNGDYDRAIADFDRAVELDSSYVDALYGRANAWRAKGVSDQAIYDYTQVIALDPSYIEAFAYRGMAYLSNDEIGRALDDFDELIKRDPNNTEGFNLRGNAHRQMGDNDLAIKDYDQAIRLAPNYALAYFNRGVAKYVMGHFTDAEMDFAKRPQTGPANPYAALWLYMTRNKAHAGNADELLRAIATPNLDAWPGPLVRLYRGETATLDIKPVSAGADAKTQKVQACEATFYTAEYELLRGNVNAAVPMFSEAAIKCPHDQPEYDGATAELAWLP
jgi:lipoprotein NlpI